MGYTVWEDYFRKKKHRIAGEEKPLVSFASYFWNPIAFEETCCFYHHYMKSHSRCCRCSRERTATESLVCVVMSAWVSLDFLIDCLIESERTATWKECCTNYCLTRFCNQIGFISQLSKHKYRYVWRPKRWISLKGIFRIFCDVFWQPKPCTMIL